MKMFDLYGDEITFQGHTVGTLSIKPGTLRDRAEGALLSIQGDELEDMLADEREAGENDGRKRGEQDAIDVAKDLFDAIEALPVEVYDAHPHLAAALKRWETYCENVANG
jgi:hypothetical protein